MQIVNSVTLQNRYNGEPTGPSLDLNPGSVAGLIFTGIPLIILESNNDLYAMEKKVFTRKHPVFLCEPYATELSLHLTFKKPIKTQQEFRAIALRLKGFLREKGVFQNVIDEVLVMSFDHEKWYQKYWRENITL